MPISTASERGARNLSRLSSPRHCATQWSSMLRQVWIGFLTPSLEPRAALVHRVHEAQCNSLHYVFCTQCTSVARGPRAGSRNSTHTWWNIDAHCVAQYLGDDIRVGLRARRSEL